jgi:hypothetical protein
MGTRREVLAPSGRAFGAGIDVDILFALKCLLRTLSFHSLYLSNFGAVDRDTKKACRDGHSSRERAADAARRSASSV